MFGIAFNLKNIIIASLVIFVAGFTAGWRVESWRSDAALYKAQVESLTKQIKARDDAANVDAAQIAKDIEEIDQLKQKVEDAERKTSPGECLPSDDADRVRNYFR